MADYIYLLQNRLTSSQRNAVEAVRESARAHNMPVFLTGGGARDLTSGAPVRDLDFAVQGDAAALVEELKAKGARVTGNHPVLGSIYLIFPGGVRAELGTTQTVAYPKPNQPEPHPAAILDDLRRRDFTANAMAISLNEGSYGLLLDPLNGVADIENRELRLASNYGFIEQPALALRVARLTARLGWTLEERTQTRYEAAKEEAYFRTLSPYDKAYELEEIFYEEDPLAVLDHLTEEGFSEVFPPAWTSSKADREALEKLRDLMAQLEQVGIHIDPAPALFPLLTAKLAPAEIADLKNRFARPGFVAQIDGLDAKSKELAGQITGRGSSAASDTWKILFAAEPEVVLWLAYSSRSGAVQAKFKAFLNEWPGMRQRIPYALMQEMRITPDLPGYDQLLDDLFFALIDGKLDTVDATRAFLEPYSPPAPVVQASPRRRPAKATRSRSRKAAGVAVTAPDDDEVDASDDDDDDDDDESEKESGSTPSEESADADEDTEPVERPTKAVKTSKPVTASSAPKTAVSPGSEPKTSSKVSNSKDRVGTEKILAMGSATAVTAGDKMKVVPAKASKPAPTPPKDIPSEKEDFDNQDADTQVSGVNKKVSASKEAHPVVPAKAATKKSAPAVTVVGGEAATPAKKQVPTAAPAKAAKAAVTVSSAPAPKTVVKKASAPAVSKPIPEKAADTVETPKKAAKVATKAAVKESH